MKDKIKELLAVLDLPEEEQWKWLDERFFDDLHGCGKDYICEQGRKELADLAFNLRDEVKNLKYRDYEDTEGFALGYAWERVYKFVTGKDMGFERWLKYEAQSKHWIIMALIAKELAKDG